MNFTLKTSHKNFVPLVSVILALLTTMSPFAIDTYLSAMPEMAKTFDVGINLVQMTVTLYFLGFALGNFLGGPLSDSFGRKRIAITGILLYGVSAILIPAVPKIEYVWILRFFQAFGGGFGTVTAMVFVKDWFEGKQVARMATIIGMIMMLAPLFAIVFPAIVLFIGSLGLIFGNGNAIILNLLPEISGSANATIGVSRFIISFIAGSIPALFHADTLTPIGVTMFGSTCIASIFPYCFYNTQKNKEK